MSGSILFGVWCLRGHSINGDNDIETIHDRWFRYSAFCTLTIMAINETKYILVRRTVIYAILIDQTTRGRSRILAYFVRYLPVST